MGEEKEAAIEALLSEAERAEETENELELLRELEEELGRRAESWSSRISRGQTKEAVTTFVRNAVATEREPKQAAGKSSSRSRAEEARLENIKRCEELQQREGGAAFSGRRVLGKRKRPHKVAEWEQTDSERSREESVLQERAQSFLKQRKMEELLQGASWKNMHVERSTIVRRAHKNAEEVARILLQWCASNDVASESDFRYDADDWVANLMLEACFTESLQRAVVSNSHRLYCAQRERWKWVMDVAQGLREYKPSRLKGAQQKQSAEERSAKWELLLRTQAVDYGEFARAVRAWLEETHHKKNCLIVWGEVSTGKTLFANAIRGLLLHRHLSNSTGSSNFALGNCLNTHVIVYEEPFLHPTLLEDMKSLCGGATMTVDAKYSVQQNLRRTPVLITSNTLQLARGHASPQAEHAIRERSYVFNFNVPVTQLLEERGLLFEPLDLACFLHKHNPATLYSQ